MNGKSLIILVLLLVLAIPLMATHALVNPVSEFSAISIINSVEELVIESDLYTTVNYEILAIEPVKYKQSWLPSQLQNTVTFANTMKSNKPRVNMKANIRRRIRSPV